MDLVGGGVDSRGGYVSKILYVKTKELGPLEGARAGRAPLDPPLLSSRTAIWSIPVFLTEMENENDSAN